MLTNLDTRMRTLTISIVSNKYKTENRKVFGQTVEEVQRKLGFFRYV